MNSQNIDQSIRMDHRQIIENLKILTSFQTDDDVSIGSISDVLEGILKNFDITNPARRQLEENAPTVRRNVLDSYIRSLIAQFSNLINVTTRNADGKSIDDSSPRPLLSVNDTNQVKKSIEFLVGFGIVPRLESGVMEPFWKASSSSVSSSSSTSMDARRRFAHDLIELASTDDGGSRILDDCVRCLYELWSSTMFKTLISSTFLGYLLASVFQLIKNDRDDSSSSNYEKYLSEIIDGTFRPELIRQLLFLQSKKSTLDGKRTAAPAWLISACARRLSSILMESRGILTFLRTLDDLDETDGSTSSLNENWHRCESLATVIAARPRQIANTGKNGLSTYYENVCDQLAMDEEIAARYSRLYVAVVQKLHGKCAPIVRRRILDPIFAILRACDDEETTTSSEATLTRSIDQLKLLYATFPMDPSFVDSFPMDILAMVMRIFFDLKNSVSHCRTTLKEIILSCFDKAPRESITRLIVDWLLMRRQSSLHVRFVAGPDGGVLAVKETSHDAMDLQERIDFLHSLMAESSKELTSAVFDDCLAMIADDCDQSTGPSTSSPSISEPLDQLEVLSIMSFVVSLLERTAVLENVDKSRMAKLLKTLIEKETSKDDRGDQDVEMESLKSQNLLLVLGLVGALFTSGEVDPEKADIRALKSALQRLSDKHADPSVSAAAKDMACILFPTTDAKDSLPSSSSQDSTADGYQQAMRDLRHPLVPIRAHALVVMTNLIKSKDVETCSKIDSLIPTILECLEDDDSYVYLAAVNCLAAAGLHRPNSVIPVLLTTFKNSSNNSENDDKDLERKLKIGEAIVKISRGLGDLAPFYGNDLVDTFLSILRQGGDEIKASCLSNVAEICRLMSFRLNSHIHELFYCAKQLLEWEKNELVRRSAINLLALLSENGDGFLEVLGDLARDFYRFVKTVYENDQDDVVRLHAQNCLENLGDHVKKFLKPLIVALD